MGTDKRRRLILAALGGMVMANMGACASIEAGKVYHTFSVGLGKGMSPVKNLRYLYGDLGWRTHSLVEPLGVLSSLSGVMSVPDVFEIGWESEAGQLFTFNVPVRSKLAKSVKDKTIRFVIMGDHIEGFLGTRDGLEERLERFY